MNCRKNYKIKVVTESSGSDNQDRALVRHHGNGVIIFIADGAGGMGGGSKAAEDSVEFINKLLINNAHFSEPLLWCEILREIDQFLFVNQEAGETTAVIAAIKDDKICGASVGDSEAWDIYNGKYNDFTEKQYRKPLIGSGEAIPIPFGLTEIDGTLLFASDGLFKYTSHSKIIQSMRENEIGKCANALIDSVRLPSNSNTFQDDIVLVICRLS